MKWPVLVVFILSLFFNLYAHAEMSWDEVGEAVIKHYKQDEKTKREISRLKSKGLNDDGIDYIWIGGECYEDECIYSYLIVHMFSRDDDNYMSEPVLARVDYSDTGTMYDVEIVQLSVLKMVPAARIFKSRTHVSKSVRLRPLPVKGEVSEIKKLSPENPVEVTASEIKVMPLKRLLPKAVLKKVKVYPAPRPKPAKPSHRP